jgi:hypothetical protein
LLRCGFTPHYLKLDLIVVSTSLVCKRTSDKLASSDESHIDGKYCVQSNER